MNKCGLGDDGGDDVDMTVFHDSYDDDDADDDDDDICYSGAPFLGSERWANPGHNGGVPKERGVFC